MTASLILRLWLPTNRYVDGIVELCQLEAMTESLGLQADEPLQDVPGLVHVGRTFLAPSTIRGGFDYQANERCGQLFQYSSIIGSIPQELFVDGDGGTF